MSQHGNYTSLYDLLLPEVAFLDIVNINVS